MDSKNKHTVRGGLISQWPSACRTTRNSGAVQLQEGRILRTAQENEWIPSPKLKA